MSLDVRESPADKPIVAPEERALLPWIDWFSHAKDVLRALTSSGSTAERPTQFLWVGRGYWDETLQKPIWLASVGDPNVWKDSQGSVV